MGKQSIISIGVWDMITHPHPNFNMGLAKPPLNLGPGYI